MAQNPKSQNPKPKIRNPNPSTPPPSRSTIYYVSGQNLGFDFGLDFHLKKMDFGFGGGSNEIIIRQFGDGQKMVQGLVESAFFWHGNGVGISAF